MNKIKITNIIFYLVIIVIVISLSAFIYNYKMFIVISGSMQDTLNMNELVLIEKAKRNTVYQIGDIITYYDYNTRDNVTHRITEITEEGYYTKGDFNNTNDLSIVKREQIVGKMIYHSYFLGNLYVNYRFALIILIILFFILIQVLVMYINKYKKENLNEEKK